MLLSHRCRLALAISCLAVPMCVAACGSSPPASTPADVTVCTQFAAYENNNTGANPLGTFESQWQSDTPPSSQLDLDVTAYLTLMESGGWEPGSGEQTQTAQAAVNVQQYCHSIGAPSGG
jgi:hypothetical protein